MLQCPSPVSKRPTLPRRGPTGQVNAIARRTPRAPAARTRAAPARAIEAAAARGKTIGGRMVACAPDRKMARKAPGSGHSSPGPGLAVACIAGLALWLTRGARTLAAPDGSWLAVLPPVWSAVAILVAATAVALAWRWLAAARP